MLERARERLLAAGLTPETIEEQGEPDVILARLASGADAVLVGRRGALTKGDALGPTVASLIRIAERCVIVCGGQPSPMRSCAVAFDGGDTSQRALDPAVPLASIVESTAHVIHANGDRPAGLQVVGSGEAALSMQPVAVGTPVRAW